MPLLRNGQWADNDPWKRLDEQADPPADSDNTQPLLCSLERFVHLYENGNRSVSGIWLKPEDDVLQLVEYLHAIQLLVVDFPTYTDGRGYTQARLLRTDMGYAGELRASGDVRPDQLLFMARSGIDTFHFEKPVDERLIRKILSRFKTSYQPSYALPIAG